MKILDRTNYDKVFELTKKMDDFNVKGRQFGLIGDRLWTPNDKENSSGRFLPFDPVIVSAMLERGIFKEA